MSVCVFLYVELNEAKARLFPMFPVFTGRQRSCEEALFSFVPVCHFVHSPEPPASLPVQAVTLTPLCTTSPPPHTHTQTCSNLFTMKHILSASRQIAFDCSALLSPTHKRSCRKVMFYTCLPIHRGLVPYSPLQDQTPMEGI